MRTFLRSPQSTGLEVGDVIPFCNERVEVLLDDDETSFGLPFKFPFYPPIVG